MIVCLAGNNLGSYFYWWAGVPQQLQCSGPAAAAASPPSRLPSHPRRPVWFTAQPRASCKTLISTGQDRPEQPGSEGMLHPQPMHVPRLALNPSSGSLVRHQYRQAVRFRKLVHSALDCTLLLAAIHADWGRVERQAESAQYLHRICLAQPVHAHVPAQPLAAAGQECSRPAKWARGGPTHQTSPACCPA